MQNELSHIVDELNDRGWQTAIHPGDVPALPTRWRSVLASWGEATRVPDAFRTRKHGAVESGLSVGRSILESHHGSPKGTERPVIANPPLVSVVDDDESVRESLPDLLRTLGFAAEAFASAEEFLASDYVGRTRCLVLDVAMPGMSGPELQHELARRGHAIPIVFITGQQDEGIRPRVLAAGAVACLLKPFSDTALLGAVNAALGVGS